MHQGKIIKIYENEGLIFPKICNLTPLPLYNYAQTSICVKGELENDFLQLEFAF